MNWGFGLFVRLAGLTHVLRSLNLERRPVLYHRGAKVLPANALRLEEGAFRLIVQGRVDWYSATLRYGFVLPNDGGERALVRQEDVLSEEPESLKNGADVTYEAVRGIEGVEAKNVRCV